MNDYIHAEDCAGMRPGDNECNCHIAYGFLDAEVRQEYDENVAEITRLRAELAAKDAECEGMRVPDGWMLISTNPSLAMLDAGWDICPSGPVEKSRHMFAVMRYDALIAAARKWPIPKAATKENSND